MAKLLIFFAMQEASAQNFSTPTNISWVSVWHHIVTNANNLMQTLMGKNCLQNQVNASYLGDIASPNHLHISTINISDI